MNEFFIPLLYSLAGVCFYAALHHLLVGRRWPVRRTHLLFAFLCLMVALYVIAKASVYRADTAEALVAMRRWEVSFGLPFFLALPWFISEYTGVRPHLFLAALSGLFVVVFAANLILPYGGAFVELPHVERMTLPWGEQVVDLRMHQPNPWYRATWVGLVLIFVYSFYAGARQYRAGMRRKARTLLFAMALFGVFVFANLLINHGVIEFTHTAEFGFLSLVVVMGLGLTFELDESERRQQAVLDNVPAAVCIKDLEGRYVLVNRGYEQLFGVAHTRVAGKLDTDLFPAGQRQLWAARDRRVLESGRSVEFEDAVDRGGDARVHYSLKFPLLYPDGAPYAICSVSTDITERKRAESEVQHLRQAIAHVSRISILGELSASLAHELNQPLTAILSNAQAGLRFLKENRPDLDEIRAILQDIARDDKRAGTVISDFRRLARRQESRREPIDLAVALREVRKIFHRELLVRHVKFEAMLEDDCILLADKAQIQQVLINLMMNAVEAMEGSSPDQRHLRLCLTRAGSNELLTTVCDSGKGIREEHLGKVFDSFWSTKSDGMGLGLGICRTIVEAHGGTIRVERNKTQGVTFRFTLPALSHTGATEREAESSGVCHG